MIWFQLVILVYQNVRFVLLEMTVLLVMVITSMSSHHKLVKYLAWMAVIAVLMLLLVINVLLDGYLIVQNRTVKK
jgi:uncharacterized membrane protein YqjE